MVRPMHRTISIVNRPEDRTESPDDDFYPVTEAARILGVTDRSVRRYLHGGKLTGHTVYLSSRPDGSVIASLDKPDDLPLLGTRLCVPADQVHRLAATQAVAS